jgi:hypothetical protein
MYSFTFTKLCVYYKQIYKNLESSLFWIYVSIIARTKFVQKQVVRHTERIHNRLVKYYKPAFSGREFISFRGARPEIPNMSP